MARHSCKQCGRCCIIHWGSFEATQADIARWMNEGRTDIMKCLETTSNNLNCQSGIFKSSNCPFLKRSEEREIYYCTINDTKPFHCKVYPEDGVCEYTVDVS